MPSAKSRDQWRPLVVCPHVEMLRRIQAACAELGLREVCPFSQYPRAGAIAGLAARHRANVCFLDLSSNQDDALLMVSEAAPAMPVVALNPRNDAELILRALRRGASEFLSDPTAEQVAEVLERLAMRGSGMAPPPSLGSVYCVIPGKPGAGASTLAIQLAVEMKRAGTPRVLLADADFLSGSVGFQLKLKSDFHFGHAAEDGLRLDEDLWSRMITPSEGVDVLLAPEDPSTPLAPDRAAGAALLSFMREHYGAAIVDLPGVSTAIAAGFAGQAEVLLVVTTNELAALHTTRRSIESLEHAGIDRARLRLILNRYLPGAGLKREDVRTALHIEPAAVLGNDYQAVQEAILAGKPVSPSASFSRGVQALARQLAGKPEAAPAAKTRSWLRFLGRRA